MALTAEVLVRCGAPKADARRFVGLLDVAMREFGITTQTRAAMFLAQLAHESMGLTRFEEIASGADYEGNKALGNTQRGDGVRFKGRGPIQLTGRWNYTHYGKLLGLDLAARPQLAAQPRYGFRLAAAYFEDRGCNKAADRGDFHACTRAINAAELHFDRRLALYRMLSKLDCAPGAAYLERGDHGDGVRMLTRRLSFVRSKATGRPYLDGKRQRFDGETEKALRAFQGEHGLAVDGRFGPKSSKKLARATQREKQRRTTAPVPAKPPAVARPVKAAAELPALVRRLERLEAESDRAWEAVVAHARGRRKALASQLKGERPAAAPRGGEELGQLNQTLRRIEQKLGTLVEIEQREEASFAAEAGHVPDTAGPPNGGAHVASAVGAAVSQAGAKAATTMAPGPPATAPAPRPRKPTEEELLARIDELDRALHRTRRRLISRYATVDQELAALAPARPKRAKPVRERGPERTKRPKPPDKPQVRALQEALNRFTERHLRDVGPLVVDGVQGPLTRARIRRVKYWLGYSKADRRKVSAGPELLKRMRHPKSARHATPAMVARGVKRRRRQRVLAKKSAAPRAGVELFDGKPVASWIAPHLRWARAHGWKGTIYSGYRTPEESEDICRGKCGAPTCRGNCAGRASNHSGRVAPRGAVDVSEHVRFGELMRRSPHSPKLINRLPATDPNHFSATGN